MVVVQSRITQLNHHHREQAPSHIDCAHFRLVLDQLPA